MAKQSKQQSNAVEIVTVEGVRLSRYYDNEAVTFTLKKDRVVCRTRVFATLPIVIIQTKDGRFTYKVNGEVAGVSSRSPQKAFSRAARAFWRF